MLFRSFFVSPRLAAKLGVSTTREALRGIPFVTAVYHSHGQFLPGDDGCPIARAERISGHEVPTVAIAIELAAATDQVAYGPEIAAREVVRSGRLVEIAVRGCERSVDAYLHVNGDRVLARTQAKIVTALGGMLEPTAVETLRRTHRGRRKNVS